MCDIFMFNNIGSVCLGNKPFLSKRSVAPTWHHLHSSLLWLKYV